LERKENEFRAGRKKEQWRVKKELRKFE